MKSIKCILSYLPNSVNFKFLLLTMILSHVVKCKVCIWKTYSVHEQSNLISIRKDFIPSTCRKEYIQWNYRTRLNNWYTYLSIATITFNGCPKHCLIVCLFVFVCKTNTQKSKQNKTFAFFSSMIPISLVSDFRSISVYFLVIDKVSLCVESFVSLSIIL